MTFCKKQGKTGWFIGGGIFALMMILLAESSAPPRTEITTPYINTTQKDFRPILRNIKTIPEHLLDKKIKRQMLLVKHLSGAPEPTDGPMAILSQMEEVRTIYLDQLDISAVEIPAAWDSEWLLKIIRQDPSVNYAGMDYSSNRVPRSLPSGTRPNDPSFGDQINLHDPVNDVDVDAPEAWTYTTGSDSVVVVVVDSDFDINNPELRPNLWVNEVELRGTPGRDDDNNNCIDDIYGCNYGPQPYFRTGNFGDEAGHGTEVASVLGARGNNNNEIAGVAWDIKLMLLHDSLSVHGYNYILKMRRRGVKIRVINYSQGPSGGGSCDPSIDRSDSAIEDCHFPLKTGECSEVKSLRQLEAEGILLVQAMENDGINPEFN